MFNDLREFISEVERLGECRIVKGADWEESTISDEEEELCKKACKLCGVDLAGADFVRTEEGIKFFEVNKSPMVNPKYPEVIVGILEERYLSK